MNKNKYKVKPIKSIKTCIDCNQEKELKLSINRFKCNVCSRILCRKHYKLGLEGGRKYYNIKNYCMCKLCNYIHNK